MTELELRDREQAARKGIALLPTHEVKDYGYGFGWFKDEAHGREGL